MKLEYDFVLCVCVRVQDAVSLSSSASENWVAVPDGGFCISEDHIEVRAPTIHTVHTCTCCPIYCNMYVLYVPLWLVFTGFCLLLLLFFSLESTDWISLGYVFPFVSQ